MLHDGQVVPAIFFSQAPREQLKVGVANEHLLGIKSIKRNQVFVGRQQNPIPILGKKGKSGDAIEKMIKPAFGTDRLEQA